MLGATEAGLLGVAAAGPWQLTVQTTGTSQTYTIDINAGTSPAITVDWADGTVEVLASTGQKTHTYAAAGTYVVKLSGRFASGGNIRLGSNAADQARLKATSAVPYIPGLVSFEGTFLNCTGLTSIPTDLFRYNTAVSTSGFSFTFYCCSGLTGAIPTDLFRYNTAVSTNGFWGTFFNCPGLTGSIPADLFKYNTLVSDNGFNSTFCNCSGLTGAIPTDLFRYNTAVSTNGFCYTFHGCTGLTGSIPADLFRYNTLVSVNAFASTFANCSGLTGAIPADLFRYNTLVDGLGFASTFANCTGLTSAPALLFAYNTNCVGFSNVFNSCNKLQLNAEIFFALGNEGTRFLNQTVDFADALHIGTFTGTQGTAPALWSCDFGTGSATKTGCFTGHTSGSVTNYADIPAAWK